jgi:hypothetical protein
LTPDLFNTNGLLGNSADLSGTARATGTRLRRLISSQNAAQRSKCGLISPLELASRMTLY